MEIFIVSIFIIGYIAITLEHSIKVNKAASAILTGVICWVVIAYCSKKSPETIPTAIDELPHHLSDISAILFFLLGAMTIVELIDAHDGFEVITKRIHTTSKRTLLWIIGFLAFFLSSMLDNLATTIVMVTLLNKLLTDKNDRWMFVSIVVIAANAGGAWSPIGDVTTTMLWIGGQITPVNIMLRLFLPSLICLLVPLIIVSFRIKGKFEKRETEETMTTSVRSRNIIFWSGLAVLLSVPFFKTITHLPPYMGMLFGLGMLWILSEIIHKDKDEEDKNAYSVVHALRKIDVPSILFFLGILLSVAAIQATGQLTQLATFLESHIRNMNVIVMTIGLLSAVVDNVPLVAAVQGMYDLNVYPADHYFWEFLAYCAGTGGSVLIIGSAAGVAAMGMQKIEFFWYLKKIALLAIVGYLSGALVYIYII
ncbi:MAG TPA: sodium:proton antiporter NhaD [Bacteroidia bacterium]|nr:sodium:proton antiporter NhaD [Bacteroidia bacterium]